jgi:ferredoxin-NADP reductase
METTVHFLERIPRTPQANSYRFTRPPGFSFQPGQYVIVSLGQEGMLVHPLSFSNGPHQDFLEFTKRMTGSAYSQYLEGLFLGDKVVLKGPIGDFSMQGIHDDIVCMAGGIGITPIRSMLIDLAHKHDRRAITLIYGNKDEEDIAFFQELTEMNLPDFKLVHVLQHSSEKLKTHQGFITSKIISTEATADLQSSAFLISGPPTMVRTVEKQLALLGVRSNQIRTDRFLGYP